MKIETFKTYNLRFHNFKRMGFNNWVNCDTEGNQIDDNVYTKKQLNGLYRYNSFDDFRNDTLDGRDRSIDRNVPKEKTVYTLSKKRWWLPDYLPRTLYKIFRKLEL